MKFTMYFYECETDQDISWYSEAIRECDGTVISVDHNFDAETAEIVVEVEDYPKFTRDINDMDQGGFAQF